MLTQISEKEHGVILDLRYASENNVFAKSFYNEHICLLHPEAEQALQKAIEICTRLDLKIKIFDGYRPLFVQEEFVRIMPGNEFISNPKTGSIPHCRGVAVDVTLCDLDGNELDMGSDFDEFSDLAFHGFNNISVEATKNRCLLMGIMMTAGFDFFRNEWWHYQLFKARDYEIYNSAI